METSPGGADEPSKILAFWRDVEVINIPPVPRLEARTDWARNRSGPPPLVYDSRPLKPGGALPWEQDNPRRLNGNKRYTWSHRIYVGVLPSHEWVRRLEQLVEVPRTDDAELERMTGQGYLASLDVDVDGKPVPGQYAPAWFAFALGRLRRRLEISDLTSEMREAKERHLRRLQQIVSDHAEGHRASAVVGWRDIAGEARAAWALVGPDAAPADFGVWVRSQRVKRPVNDDELMSPSVTKDFFDSFFRRDLEKVQKAVSSGHATAAGAALRQYLGPATAPGERADLLQDPGVFAHHLSPDALTRGRWPSMAQHSLLLAQQAAVGVVMHDLHDGDGIVAINGPPGTGKTTLLRDVIAEVVVERAKCLAGLEHPWHLFEGKTTVCGQAFSPLRGDIVGQTGIPPACSSFRLFAKSAKQSRGRCNGELKVSLQNTWL